MTTPAPRRRPTPRGWAVPRHGRTRAPGRQPRDRHRRRRIPSPPVTAAFALMGVLLLACGGGTAEVVGVTVEVPAGWQESTAATDAAELVSAAGWRGGADDASTLQVVVGCGPGTARDLAVAAITRARPPLEVTTADEVLEVEDTLVLVEISTPVSGPQRELVDTTLASVALDAETLGAHCP